MAKMKQQMFLQFNEQEVELSAVEANVKKDWKDAGRKLTEIESLDIYVKPQEGKAYYVVNWKLRARWTCSDAGQQRMAHCRGDGSFFCEFQKGFGDLR